MVFSFYFLFYVDRFKDKVIFEWSHSILCPDRRFFQHGFSSFQKNKDSLCCPNGRSGGFYPPIQTHGKKSVMHICMPRIIIMTERWTMSLPPLLRLKLYYHSA
jgi:hypothetical protein